MAKRIDKELFDRLPLIPRGYKSPTTVFSLLDRVGVAEGVMIGRKEWTRKSRPDTAIHSYFRKHGPNKKFTVRTLQKKKGWAVLRLR